MRKIALIGSAPSSVQLAPYHDQSWTIFGCSPGAYPVVKRADVWFELHRWEPPTLGDPVKQKSWYSPEYVEWLRKFPGKLYLERVLPDIPNGVVYPVEAMIEEHGPYFFTSSLSWMFAAALAFDDVEEIGLWGVDMSANEEYQWQRPGCHYFITLARKRGIRITVPYESDLLQPPFLYGIGESSPEMVKMTARRRELESRLQNALAMKDRGSTEEFFLKGALDDMKWFMDTWVSDRDPRVKRWMEKWGPTLETPRQEHSLETKKGNGADGEPLPIGEWRSGQLDGRP